MEGVFSEAVVRVLLTNDDGYSAEGMSVLKRVAARMFSEVWVSAPVNNCSGMGVAVSMQHTAFSQQAPREFAVSGTPADSVLFGLQTLFDANTPPDLVISGINCGSNLGCNIMLSGTIAAASVACAWGIPSFAVSQDYHNDQVYWHNSEKVVEELIPMLLNDERWDKKCVMSLNIPLNEIQGIKFMEQGSFDVRWDILRAREKSKCSAGSGIAGESPVQCLRNGYVIITPLTVFRDVTDHDTLKLFSDGLKVS